MMAEATRASVARWVKDNARWYTGVANGVVDTALLARDARLEHAGEGAPDEYRALVDEALQAPTEQATEQRRVKAVQVLQAKVTRPQAGLVMAYDHRLIDASYSVYIAAEQGLDVDGRTYAVSCDTHGALIGTNSKTDARALMRSADWCHICRALHEAHRAGRLALSCWYHGRPHDCTGVAEYTAVVRDDGRLCDRHVCGACLRGHPYSTVSSAPLNPASVAEQSPEAPQAEEAPIVGIEEALEQHSASTGYRMVQTGARAWQVQRTDGAVIGGTERSEAGAVEILRYVGHYVLQQEGIACPTWRDVEALAERTQAPQAEAEEAKAEQAPLYHVWGRTFTAQERNVTLRALRARLGHSRRILELAERYSLDCIATEHGIIEGTQRQIEALVQAPLAPAEQRTEEGIGHAY